MFALPFRINNLSRILPELYYYHHAPILSPLPKWLPRR